jgi:hypothetical protein
MATLRIKLCGINNIDMASLSSVIQLSDSRLNSEWAVSQSGQIDLFIFGLDTEEGRSMLRSHRSGVCAALAQKNQTNAVADFIIKKPIRTKQLAEILNAVDEKVALAKQSDKIKPTPKIIEAVPKPPVQPEVKQAKKASLLSSLFKHLTRRKSPAADLPALSLYTPTISEMKLKTIVDPKILANWIDALPKDDAIATIDALLENLIPLNRRPLADDTRLALLELYRDLTNVFVFNRDVETVKLEMTKPAVFETKISQLSIFLEELALGYKTVVMAAYQRGQRPQLDNQFLFAIIRATESIGLLITHAFRHYHAAPTGTVHELHQLYLYCEAGDVLDKPASLKTTVTKKPFIHHYCQIMLTGIADPYSLSKYDVFRLFNLMAKMAGEVTITPLSDHQKSTDNNTVLAGSFSLDCNSDAMPLPLHHIDIEKRQQSDIRMLNPQGVLFAIEQFFDAAASISTLGRYELDVQLLKKVIPQFNANYQRQYQPLPSVTTRPIRLANGFDAIHHCLASTEDVETTEWMIDNQGSAGLMAKCNKADIPALNIGDFLGVIETDTAPRLGTIRWLHIDNNDTVQIGLQIHPGNPAAVSISPKGNAIEIKCLYLPPVEEISQKETMIVGKGNYSPNRLFHVKDSEKTYTIVTQKLLNYSLNYEQFNYKIVDS